MSGKHGGHFMRIWSRLTLALLHLRKSNSHFSCHSRHSVSSQPCHFLPSEPEIDLCSGDLHHTRHTRLSHKCLTQDLTHRKCLGGALAIITVIVFSLLWNEKLLQEALSSFIFWDGNDEEDFPQQCSWCPGEILSQLSCWLNARDENAV